jgi:homoserine O-succinyltransferase/O-acetyltransferase
MPVLLDGGTLGVRLFAASEPTARIKKQELLAIPNPIELGLVNNMPDLALEQTERQIVSLLDAAAGDAAVRLKLYALPDLPRGELGQRHLRRMHYRNVDDLLSSELDGVIITGTEPRCADLTLEPYWHTLTEVFDWARHNGISTIASCLAVHAAVLHFDGINRRPLERKCFGVFKCKKVSNNSLLEGVPLQFRMPHSRWNEICEDALASAGYNVLVRVDGQGVDMFAKVIKGLFVFFQGHPEYEAWTLLGEYRRDIARFLTGDQESYPEMPRGYFDQESERTLEAFRRRALRNRRKEMMTLFPSGRLAGKLAQTWRPPAVRTYANWLKYIISQKSRCIKPSRVAAVSPARTDD